MKGSYLHHKEVKAAQGIKIAAPGLESAVAGTQMLVVQPGDNLEFVRAKSIRVRWPGNQKRYVNFDVDGRDTHANVHDLIDDVLGVWPLHGLCGMTGGLLCGVFGQTALGGLGGVGLVPQLVGTAAGVGYAFAVGLLVYGGLKLTMGIRLDAEKERRGADLAIHRITAYPEDDASKS